jgi:S-adenosylmethionine decarboxylase proenzyme
VVDTFARHLLVELEGCDRAVLNDEESVRALMRRAAEAAGASVVSETFHRYRPQGITGVVVIEESHFSVHTWPECGYAAIDFYTCGECAPERAAEVLREGFGAQRVETMLVERGLRGAGGSLRVEHHAEETGDARATLATPGR